MKEPKKFDGQDAVDELNRQLEPAPSMPINEGDDEIPQRRIVERPHLVILSQDLGGRSMKFEGYVVDGCYAEGEKEGGGCESYTFLFKSAGESGRFVFGQEPDYEKNLYPLLGIEIC